MTKSMSEEVLARLAAIGENGPDLEMPPKCFLDMEGEFVDFDGKRILRTRFPVLERYQNPLRFMQGGMIVAAIDNTIGPLSYLVAPPSVTTQLNVSYIRPVTAEDEYITVDGIVDEQTRRYLFLRADVKNPGGRLVAMCHATFAILQPNS